MYHQISSGRDRYDTFGHERSESLTFPNALLLCRLLRFIRARSWLSEEFTVWRTLFSRQLLVMFRYPLCSVFPCFFPGFSNRRMRNTPIYNDIFNVPPVHWSLSRYIVP
ncbi:uncharacterized protein P174DRAFT_2739 [Aspergillus novofumigatus IBT 16806]|uniref:Uncharacterized protein n=1 Tax=Aspergillus novofumigatus (strain IBT 16806) TaxID=1392255 RepID=A0A2I1CK96_ASPN1|nr:uncharacterized protein P174DRAFT_2739 [Aspergillus novofumigatus IBT 16806]PKX98047.1 hypothetical protein P174DRAFT_2739 [Aspergillus novofumigatus IBT 16806]